MRGRRMRHGLQFHEALSELFGNIAIDEVFAFLRIGDDVFGV